MSEDKGLLAPKGEADSQEIIRKLEEDLRLLEEDLDFKPYLEAVNAGSSRTRSTVYLLVAMLVIILTAYRNTTGPDWLDKRLSKFQLASACVRSDNPNECKADDPSLTTECKQAVDYSKQFLFSQEQNPFVNSERVLPRTRRSDKCVNKSANGVAVH